MRTNAPLSGVSSANTCLQTAVIGLGRKGHAFASALLRDRRAHLVAVCDASSVVLERWRGDFPGVRGYQDYQRLLLHDEAAGIDAVVIASPVAMRGNMIIEALEANKHVFVSHPIARDLDTLQRVIGFAQSRPELKLTVCLPRRFDSAYMEAIQMIALGHIGVPYMIKSAAMEQHDPHGICARRVREAGGLLGTSGVEEIDAARWLISSHATSGATPNLEVRRVYATAQTVRPIQPSPQDPHPVIEPDNYLATVEFYSGIVLHFHLSLTSIHGPEYTCEVYGDKARAAVGDPNARGLHIKDEWGTRQLASSLADKFGQANEVALSLWVQSVMDGRQNPVPLSDVWEATKIAMALKRSAESGMPVEFVEGAPLL